MKIDKNVPVPDAYRNGRALAYPWPDMEPGDSFSVEGDPMKTAQRLRTAASAWSKRNQNRRALLESIMIKAPALFLPPLLPPEGGGLPLCPVCNAEIVLGSDETYRYCSDHRCDWISEFADWLVEAGDHYALPCHPRMPDMDNPVIQAFHDAWQDNLSPEAAAEAQEKDE